MAHETTPLDPGIYWDDGANQWDFMTSIENPPLTNTLVAVPTGLPFDQQPNINNASLVAPLVAPFLDFSAPEGGGLFMSTFFGGFVNLAAKGDLPGYIGQVGFSSWQDMVTKWKSYVLLPSSQSTLTAEERLPATSGTSNTYYQWLYNAFTLMFLNAVGSGSSASNTGFTGGIVGDWSILTTGTDAIPFTLSSTDNTNNPFILAFNHFVQNLDFVPLQGTSTQPMDFFDQFVSEFGKTLRTTVLLQTPTSSTIQLGDFTPPSGRTTFTTASLNTELATYKTDLEKLPSYQQIYAAFGPQSGGDFNARLKQFAKDEIAANGYFIPSQAVGRWIQTLQEESGFNVVSQGLINSLSGNSSEKVIIINRILILLIKIIQSLQDLGIAQANHLKYRSQYQQAYTALQSQIPVFLQGTSPSAINGATKDQAAARNELNASLNANLTDNLRSLRGLQEDAAKKEQSDLNQTNDAVNQQTDMCTTFIQQLSTLLGSIFR